MVSFGVALKGEKGMKGLLERHGCLDGTTEYLE